MTAASRPRAPSLDRQRMWRLRLQDVRHAATVACREPFEWLSRTGRSNPREAETVRRAWLRTRASALRPRQCGSSCINRRQTAAEANVTFAPARGFLTGVT